MRGWLRVTVIKHLFQHRYDYRAEWLRFTRTMGKGEDPSSPLEERAVQAIADIADSPSGLLLAPGEHGELVLAAHWRWPSPEVPAEAMPAAATDDPSCAAGARRPLRRTPSLLLGPYYPLANAAAGQKLWSGSALPAGARRLRLDGRVVDLLGQPVEAT